MAQHDYSIANGSGAAVRSDLNNALSAIVSQNSGTTEPTTTYAYMRWADTTAGVMKMRNGANNAWITLYQLDGEWSTIAFENGSASAPSIYFKDSGTDTGIYSPGTDQVAISTNGTQRVTVDTAATTSTLPVVHPLGAVGTPSITFTGDLNTGIWSPAADTIAFSEGGVEAMRIDSSGRVGIGSNAPSGKLEIAGTTGAAPVIVRASSSEGAYIDFYNNAASSNRFRIGQGYSSGSDNVGMIAVQANADLVFQTNTLERSRLTASGQWLVGTSSARNLGSIGTCRFTLEGTGYNSSSVAFVNNENSVQPPYLILAKSRGGSVGSNTIVQSGDSIGQIVFAGADGTDVDTRAAEILCAVDGTPGANDMPGRLVFSTTADGASSPTERMKINNVGVIETFGATSNLSTKSNAGAGTTNYLIAGSHSCTTISTGGTTSFYVWSNGNVQNTNGSYTTISDAKLKENIVNTSSQWNDLKAIQIRNWNFKAETGYGTHRQIGPIAQELEAVCPGLVFETPDRDEDGNETGEVTKGVNQSVLYMKAVKALQEAMERIEQLESEMAAVKAQLS